MDNEKLLDLLENKPEGLLNQLKYFEYNLAELEKQKGNSDLKRRIRREIDNLRYDVSKYEGLLNQINLDLEKIFSEGENNINETNSIIKKELDKFPYKKEYLFVGLIGTSIALLMQSIIIPNYILLIVSLTLLAVSVYLFNQKSKLLQIKKETKNNHKSLNQLKWVVEKMESIEAVKQEIFFAQKRNDSTEKSNRHFENSEWLEEKVLEFEADGKSQNKALELTRELYEKEFDRKPPAKITILRYMGRAD